MGKTRKCRLSDSKAAVHEMAVKLRKKTDEQLVTSFQEIYDQGFKNGLEKNQLPDGQIFVDDKARNRFLALVQITPGIGKSIFEKIEKIAVHDAASKG